MEDDFIYKVLIVIIWVGEMVRVGLASYFMLGEG